MRLLQPIRTATMGDEEDSISSSDGTTRSSLSLYSILSKIVTFTSDDIYINLDHYISFGVFYFTDGPLARSGWSLKSLLVDD